MKRSLIALTLLASLAIPASIVLADDIPCAVNMYDYDGDGVLNGDDSDEFDSCRSDPDGTGLADCTTGAGDGVPDVRLCE